VHSFFVARSDGRERGCLCPPDLGNASRVILKLSDLTSASLDLAPHRPRTASHRFSDGHASPRKSS
jgi:hypothetical protein